MYKFLKRYTTEITIVSISIIFQLVFFYSVRINFECDSAAYYNSAVGYFSDNPLLISPYRGPMYSIILYFFGITTTGAIYPLLLFQAGLGVLMPLLIYLSVKDYGKKRATVAATIFILSSVGFTSAKLILAEQIFVFLTVLTIFLFSKYISKGGTVYVFLFSSVAALAAMTRWEGLALIFSLVVIMIYRSIISKKTAHLIIASIIFILELGSYAGTRVYIYKDWNMFALQNGTGSQWLWRQYYSQGFEDFSGEISDATGAYSGDSIQYVYRTTIDYVMQNDAEFEILLGTSESIKNKSNITKNVQVIESLINEAWLNSSEMGSHVTFLMSRAIVSKHGLSQGDKILQKAALNILLSESAAQKVMIKQSLSLVGFLTPDISQKIQWYEGPEINIGGCLVNTQNERFIENHNQIYQYYNAQIHEYASVIRNLIRLSFPIFILYAIAQVIVTRRSNQMFFLMASATLINVIIVGLTGGGAYGKYDLTIFTYLIVGLSCYLNFSVLKKVKIYTESLFRYLFITTNYRKSKNIENLNEEPVEGIK